MIKIRWMETIGVLGLFAWVACDGGSTDTEVDGGSNTEIDAADTPTRTVTGIYKARHVTGGGEVIVPNDLSSATITALVGPAQTSITGTGDAQGTFTIPGVPVGTFTLRIDDRYIVTSADAIDLSYDVLGRPSAPATNVTPLTFNVTNLAPWQTTDDLEMFSPDNGTIAFTIENAALAGTPAASANSLSGFAVDLRRSSYPALIDGGAGDRLTVFQLATQLVSGTSYKAVARTLEAPSFTVTNGGSSTISGAFTTVPQSRSLGVTFDRPAFDAALRAQLPVQDPLTYPLLALQALPGAATRGIYHGAPDLVVYEPGYVSDATAITTAWPYGDPFPSAWTRFVTARFYTSRKVDVAGSPLTVYASIAVDRSLTDTGTIGPEIGPVVSPTVNGQDAYGALTGVGVTPTISWSPPAVGAADRYYVRVMRVLPGAAPARSLAATIETSATSLTIPPGILMTGTSYMFDISARSAPGIDLAATPGRWSLPEAESRIASALATP